MCGLLLQLQANCSNIFPKSIINNQMYNSDKNSKKMETKQINKKIVRHGFINELAKLCDCSRLTVSNALYHNARGKKADMVRCVFKKNYQSVEI
jgi:hypothetical protein